MLIKRAFAVLALVLSFAVGVSIGDRSVKAQTASTVLQISGAWATHASCATVPGQTSLCLASDGLWQSLNGAAYAQVGVGGVLSVNGKTGAVVLNASTTATTTVQ